MGLKSASIKFVLAMLAVFTIQYTYAQNIGSANVDKKTGRLSYNIPLVSLPAGNSSVPINLQYNSGVGAYQTSTWVGLGWDLGFGSIERSVVGYPDDWKGKTNYSYNWKMHQDLKYEYDKKYHFYKQDMFRAKKLFAANKTVYGPLYYSEAYNSLANGMQDPNTIMDVYSELLNHAQFANESPENYDKENNFMFPAYDSYFVSGPGISGSMSPKRLECGGLLGQGYEDLQYMEAQEFSQSMYHTSKPGHTFSKPYNQVHFYFNNEHSGFYKVEEGDFDVPNPNISFNSVGEVLGLIDYTAGNVVAANPNGETYYNTATKQKGGIKHVIWYTNGDIADNGLDNYASKGVIEYEPHLSNGYRSDANQCDPDGIGGYSITDEYGFTYHYALPVYNYENYRLSFTAEKLFAFVDGTRDKFAIRWLLTAVTGPDFEDDYPYGIIGDNDNGYWVKYNYGLWSDGYVTLNPKWNEDVTEGGDAKAAFVNDYAFNTNRVFKYNRMQLYYINNIETNTHTAHFIYDINETEEGVYSSRSDYRVYGITRDGSAPYSGTHPAELIYIYNERTPKKLFLDKIVVSKNTFAIPSNIATTPIALEGTGRLRFQSYTAEWISGRWKFTEGNPATPVPYQLNIANNVIDVNDFTAYESEIRNNAIAIIDLNYNYTLKEEYKNVTDGENYHKNLSLCNIQWQNANGESNTQPLLIDYYEDSGHRFFSKNVNEWGYNYYNPFAWNLKKVTGPLGNEVSIEYEKNSFDKQIVNELFAGGEGPGIRVKQLNYKTDSRNSFAIYEYFNGLTTFKPLKYSSIYLPYMNLMPSLDIIYGKTKVTSFNDNNEKLGSVEYIHELPEPLTDTEYDSYTLNLSGYLTIEDASVSDQLVMGDATKSNNLIKLKTRTAKVIDNTNAIGRLLSKREYNSNNELLNETIFQYANPSELVAGIVQESFYNIKSKVHKYNETIESLLNCDWFATSCSKIEYPSVLKSVISISNGASSRESYEEYDFKSGAATRTIVVDPSFKSTTIKSVPAYKINEFANMGSKLDNENNSNQLADACANYIYDGNVLDNQKITGASIKTFTDRYVKRAITENGFEFQSGTANFQRANKTYVWKGNVNDNGYFTTDEGGNQFAIYDETQGNWAELIGEQNANGWKCVLEQTLVNSDFSALESRNVISRYSSTKSYNNEDIAVSSGQNANYMSHSYCGFEDKHIYSTDAGNVVYYEGEVISQNSNQVVAANFAHSGNCYAQVTAADGPYFKTSTYSNTAYENQGLQTDRSYRAFVWVRNTSPAGSGLRVLIEETAMQPVRLECLKSNATMTIGDWSLLQVDFDIAKRFEGDVSVICFGGSDEQPAFFDDLGLKPFDASIAMAVSDPKNYNAIAQIGDDGLATKFEYDNFNRLVKVYGETPNGLQLLKENEFNTVSQSGIFHVHNYSARDFDFQFCNDIYTYTVSFDVTYHNLKGTAGVSKTFRAILKDANTNNTEQERTCGVYIAADGTQTVEFNFDLKNIATGPKKVELLCDEGGVGLGNLETLEFDLMDNPLRPEPGTCELLSIRNDNVFYNNENAYLRFDITNTNDFKYYFDSWTLNHSLPYGYSEPKKIYFREPLGPNETKLIEYVIPSSDMQPGGHGIGFVEEYLSKTKQDCGAFMVEGCNDSKKVICTGITVDDVYSNDDHVYANVKLRNICSNETVTTSCTLVCGAGTYTQASIELKPFETKNIRILIDDIPLKEGHTSSVTINEAYIVPVSLTVPDQKTTSFTVKNPLEITSITNASDLGYPNCVGKIKFTIKNISNKIVPTGKILNFKCEGMSGGPSMEETIEHVINTAFLPDYEYVYYYSPPGFNSLSNRSYAIVSYTPTRWYGYPGDRIAFGNGWETYPGYAVYPYCPE